ncbi:MAG: glucosamine-6-phosphate deaminase-like protein [Syntrophorhabdus sp. PtaB.Bin006]|nr:MAG: glucosamine-6-phosphate deaminase-like protein [Syntrophorhabdus sp. PtaB.Bin006]
MSKTKLTRGIFFCLIAIFLLMPLTLRANILIISPHPDDDIIMASGVIRTALVRGESVRVVYMTNGDYAGGVNTGYTRQAEAVAGQLVLGMQEDNLIFLGYPDSCLNELYTRYPSSSDVFVTKNGQSATYGNRGLGRTDYHTYAFGSAAFYNGYNVTGDLKSIIYSFQPDHIVVTSEFDAHSDHKTAYMFLKHALSKVLEEKPDYNPTIHKTIIRQTSSDWPNLLDSTAYFTEIPNLSGTGLIWGNRESLDAPLSMQSTFYPENLKHLATDAHVTQKGSSEFLGRFIHKDEFFWVEQYSGSNQPPVANAGLDQIVEEGVATHLDGSKSFDHNYDPVTYMWRQTNGTAVTLSDPTSVNPAFTAPTGLSHDEILTFELIVSDGVLVTLPDHTNVLVRSSAPQPVYSNINAQIASVNASSTFRTSSVTNVADGCTDGYPGDATCEWISNGNRGEWVELHWVSPVTVGKVVIHDRPNIRDQVLSGTLVFSDGSSIQVGPLENSARGVEYRFPRREITWLRLIVNEVSSTTSYAGLAEIEVFEARENIAPFAIVAASTESEYTHQQAIKAVDGCIDGYPGDPACEWATKSEKAGAWLELSWPVGHAVDQVILYDRPNSTDQILSGTITFSDGSSIHVGPLENSGKGVAYSFPRKEITWLRLTINSVKTGTANVGLAEIEVFEIGVSGANNTTQVNIAPDATVVASSQNTRPDQQAIKAVDGCIDGYPGDPACEWATVAEKAGAWIELAWPIEHRVNKVVLYDRCNSYDRILGGIITFSDGANIEVGPLENSCKGMMYTFSARPVNWLRFTVTRASTGTANVGLAEIEVFETSE